MKSSKQKFARVGWFLLYEDSIVLKSQVGDAIFEAGWYWLDLRLDTASGRTLLPNICHIQDADYMTIPLESLSELEVPGGFSGVIRLDKAVKAVVLDFGPSANYVDTSAACFINIGKFAAALRMAKRVRRHVGSLEFVSTLLKLFVQKGARGVGDWLYSEYFLRDTDYGLWCKRFMRITKANLAVLRERAGTLTSPPLISIVLPVYNTEPKWLSRCLNSVIDQAYQHWELCIADDASTREETKATLRSYAARDHRIKVVYRELNGHISAATNSALALTTGDWIALLDHDDELPPYALFVVAQAISMHPDAGLFYSDEDKIRVSGERFDPYFKPDWNPDLFYGHNMVSHFGVYRADMVRQVGGFREGYEGSQDYDLALRCIEQLSPEQIVHIPQVLYHWRAIPGSTAMATHEKSYAAEAAERALNDHFLRTKQYGLVVEAIEGGNRIYRPLPDKGEPRVSLIIPTRDRVDLLRMCISSILEYTDYKNYEIIVVDNQSVEAETLAYFTEVADDQRVRIIPFDAPFNYSLINNAAVKKTLADVVGLVNNDIEVISPGWLREMVSHAIRPEIGCVGAMLYYPNNTIQHAGVILGAGGVANHAYLQLPRGYPGHVGRARLVQNLSAVTGACLLVRRSVYEEVGGLDERLCIAFNDVDFCLRVRDQGYRNLWTPFAELYHHESATRGIEDTPQKRLRFEREVQFMIERWGDQLLNDPAYNPNLSLTAETFKLAVPPRQLLREVLKAGMSASRS